MPFRGILGRPSTSASSNKRYSTLESSHDGSQAGSSIDRGHRKIGSLHRLSLSFMPSQDSTFFPQLTQEPEQLQSRQNSLQKEELPPPSPPPPPEHKPETQSDALLVPNPGLLNVVDGTETTPKPTRFNLMKFRYLSDPQLSTRFKKEAKKPMKPPEESEPPPQIITTAPTEHHETGASPVLRKSRDRYLQRAFSTFRRSQVIRDGDLLKLDNSSPLLRSNDSLTTSTPRLTRHQSEIRYSTMSSESLSTPFPPAYGDHSDSQLAIPVSRLSESHSEGSSSSHGVYAQTTTTHLVSTTTTFFKLKGTKDKKEKKKKSKDKGPLFPLPERVSLPAETSARTSMSNNDGSANMRKSISPSRRSTQVIRWNSNLSDRHSMGPSPMQSATALTNAPLGSPGPAFARKQSTLSANSGSSTPTGSLIPPRLGARGRSSTLGSLGRSERFVEPQAQIDSARNSTSTAGRKSFSDLLAFSNRMRQNSAPPKHSNSGSNTGSKSNSFQIAREPEPEVQYPRRQEEDTPASYLEKLSAAIPKGAMATVLCKGSDEFSKTCLRKYMRGFSYFGESIDMSIRKMLMEVILPKETQQIDRLLAGFADRYHECNPGIFVNADEANFVAFSILLLQSDNHNKNNKRKMTKDDYVKNTQNGKISVCEDVLECFYDNICYTPFIHFEDEVAVNSHRLAAPKVKKTLIEAKTSDSLKGPVDPYTLILDNKLDILRPPLKDVMDTEEPYAAPGSTETGNAQDNHKAFVHAAILQIVSARSRPDAFMNQATITNPAEAQAGIVSIKVAKVGLLWRKSAKKKKAKSPWQEWGAILTDSKLYFFKDVGWAKKLIGQYENHKTSTRNVPLVFKPPLESFAPDALMSMDDAVALTDSTYTRHKNAFTFIKHGGFEEVFLGNSASDVGDWISRLNYAATFRTAGVRMRGLLGTTYEGKNLYRKNSETSALNDSATEDQVAPAAAKATDPQAAWEIMFYRRQLVSEKISTFDDHVAGAQKELEYLQRNARHILLLLPVQQKTREALVYSAGLMNAKLQWTRKEIWRAKTHRDILIKDLEAEATHAFPVPALKTALSAQTTPLKSTHHKTYQHLPRTDTDKTNLSGRSPLGPPPQSTERRPSQAVLEQIRIEATEQPELAAGRRKSTTSQRSLTPSVRTSRLGDGLVANSPSRNPSSILDHPLSPASDQTEEQSLMDAGLLNTDSPDRHFDSDSTPVRHSLPHSYDGSLKDRTGSVRRSLQRTLRDSSHHAHVPHHVRSKKGRDSNSSVAGSDDGSARPTSLESKELKRDPTGRFVLHGKKASVITVNPDWQLSNEERLKLRENLSAHGETDEEADTAAALVRAFPHATSKNSLHIDTAMLDSKHRSSDHPSRPVTALTTTSTTSPDSPLSLEQMQTAREEQTTPALSRRGSADTETDLPGRPVVYSAVTTPGLQQSFYSAASSPITADGDGRSESSDIDMEEQVAVKAAQKLAKAEEAKMVV